MRRQSRFAGRRRKSVRSRARSTERMPGRVTASSTSLSRSAKGEKPPATPAAVLSLVCGVLLCLGPVTGLTAIVAGLVARAQVQRRPTVIGGGTMAAIGIALGIVNLLMSTLGIFYYLSTAE